MAMGSAFVNVRRLGKKEERDRERGGGRVRGMDNVKHR